MQNIGYDLIKPRKDWIAIYIIMSILILQTFIITMYSSQPGEISKLSSQIIVNKMDWVPKYIPREKSNGSIWTLTYIIRKLAHLYNFFIIGVLLYEIWHKLNYGILGMVAVSLVGLLIGSLDELHQCFVPGRGGFLEDVAVDFSGVILGMCFLKIFLGLIFKKRCKNEKRKRKLGETL